MTKSNLCVDVRRQGRWSYTISPNWLWSDDDFTVLGKKHAENIARRMIARKIRREKQQEEQFVITEEDLEKK